MIMDEFKVVALEMIRKYALYAFFVGIIVGAMVARSQIDQGNL
jgi:flagellar biosynthesis protein FliQ